jgi:hypothetical protein
LLQIAAGVSAEALLADQESFTVWAFVRAESGPSGLSLCGSVAIVRIAGGLLATDGSAHSGRIRQLATSRS